MASLLSSLQIIKKFFLLVFVFVIGDLIKVEGNCPDGCTPYSGYDFCGKDGMTDGSTDICWFNSGATCYNPYFQMYSYYVAIQKSKFDSASIQMKYTDDRGNSYSYLYSNLLLDTAQSTSNNNGNYAWSNAELFADNLCDSFDICGTKNVTIEVINVNNFQTEGTWFYILSCNDELAAPNPTSLPSIIPTEQPSGNPTNQPTDEPTIKPTDTPTIVPTNIPSIDPTNIPTTIPSLIPTNKPSTDPTMNPSNHPSQIPTNVPTFEPTLRPSKNPVEPLSPTERPSLSPSNIPSVIPTNVPSFEPTVPSNAPTTVPSKVPSTIPSMIPSNMPSTEPTHDPTGQPTDEPTFKPTVEPTDEPTKDPTTQPTERPTNEPTIEPSSFPTLPTQAPLSGAPTMKPSWRPTESPSLSPTLADSGKAEKLSTNNNDGTDTELILVLIIGVLGVILCLVCISIVFCIRYQKQQVLLVEGITEMRNKRAALLAAQTSDDAEISTDTKIANLASGGGGKLRLSVIPGAMDEKQRKNNKIRGSVANYMARNKELDKLKIPGLKDENSKSKYGSRLSVAPGSGNDGRLSIMKREGSNDSGIGGGLGNGGYAAPVAFSLSFDFDAKSGQIGMVEPKETDYYEGFVSYTGDLKLDTTLPSHIAEAGENAEQLRQLALKEAQRELEKKEKMKLKQIEFGQVIGDARAAEEMVFDEMVNEIHVKSRSASDVEEENPNDNKIDILNNNNKPNESPNVDLTDGMDI